MLCLRGLYQACKELERQQTGVSRKAAQLAELSYFPKVNTSIYSKRHRAIAAYLGARRHVACALAYTRLLCTVTMLHPYTKHGTTLRKRSPTTLRLSLEFSWAPYKSERRALSWMVPSLGMAPRPVQPCPCECSVQQCNHVRRYENSQFPLSSLSATV
jgi:hypothetical protein